MRNIALRNIALRNIALRNIAAAVSFLLLPMMFRTASPVRPAFEHIFVIVLEKNDYAAVQKDAYFAQLAARGQLLTNYWALTHPSQPNYIAMIFGDVMSVTNSANYDIAGRNLVEQLEAHELSWKTYQENYPGNCCTKSFEGPEMLYGRKHNPFISADSVRTNPQRCARIVDAAALDADIAADALPNFSFYAPNKWHNAHNS